MPVSKNGNMDIIPIDGVDTMSTHAPNKALHASLFVILPSNPIFKRRQSRTVEHGLVDLDE